MTFPRRTQTPAPFSREPSSGSSSTLPNIQRGGACSNCRRRKVRCDGGRPICGQCTTRPPRSGDACRFEQDAAPGHQTPIQMQGTIESLSSRIKEIERVRTGESPSPPPTAHIGEPPKATAHRLINAFIERFSGSGYFFLDRTRFLEAATLPLPFGHLSRPSPALLSAVYLWGSILTTSSPRAGLNVNHESFHIAVLQHLPGDLRGFATGIQPKLVMETIQAEILISLYYLHAALPIPGRFHAATVASLALSAGLNRVSGLRPVANLPYPVEEEEFLPPPADAVEADERVDAFWTVVFLNNVWVAVTGSGSPMPDVSKVDIPWPSASVVGSTISRFLLGQEADGYSSTALLVKASVLLERVSLMSSRAILQGHTLSDGSLESRLHTFQASLPPPNTHPYDRPLIFAHALTDLALLRFHSPLAVAHSSDHSRYQTLAAAERIVSSLSDAQLVTGGDPLYAVSQSLQRAQKLGLMLCAQPICVTLHSVYTEQLSLLRCGAPTPQARAEYQEIEQRMKLVTNVVQGLARTSPVMQQCLQLLSVGY
ncbi:hypothetical protein MKEN_01106600 [Mycena kentingensis (nom. inval.)]|nr:hypothetical protein MKEN_01106600 [Mycena kentingensis (nom. inval.)]